MAGKKHYRGLSRRGLKGKGITDMAKSAVSNMVKTGSFNPAFGGIAKMAGNIFGIGRRKVRGRGIQLAGTGLNSVGNLGFPSSRAGGGYDFLRCR